MRVEINAQMSAASRQQGHRRSQTEFTGRDQGAGNASGATGKGFIFNASLISPDLNTVAADDFYPVYVGTGWLKEGMKAYLPADDPDARLIGWSIFEQIGIGVWNPRGVTKILVTR